jgi:hypothetical protein
MRRIKLRCATAHRRISRFRVWSFGPSRNDGWIFARFAKKRPSGDSVSSPVSKNIPLSLLPKSILEAPPSRPTEGRLAIVTDAGRDAVDAVALGAQAVIAGQVYPVSDQPARGRTALKRLRQNFDGRHMAGRSVWLGIAAYGEVVWSWHPLLMSSRRRRSRPNRAQAAFNPPMTVTKRNSSPGRARRKPLKPLRGECRAFPV